MGWQVRMTAEVRAWLADLAARDPDAACQAGAAVLALLDQGTELGPPLVARVPALAAAAARPHEGVPGDDPGDELDGAYQQLLAALSAIRRDVAGVATLRKRLELRLSQAEPGPGASELRDKLTELTAAEAEIAAGSRRVQAHVDAFRAQKESIRAAYAAAAGLRAVREVYVLTGEPEPDSPPREADAVLADARSRARTMLAQARDVLAILAGEQKDEDAAAAPDRPASGAPQQPGAPAAPVELFALRPAAPACLATRILFTVAPDPAHPAVVLLAAGTEHAGPGGGPDRLIELAHTRAAADLPGSGGYDGDDFVAEFFAGAESELVARVAALAAASAPRSLADLRELAGLSQEDLAGWLGLDPARVAALERGDDEAPAWPLLSAYLAALGARLDVSADLGTQRVPLAWRPGTPPA